MAADDEEEVLLRSVTLQNANAILLARQRAEQELLRAKESLELKTVELAHSLASLRATLESTTDGILVTDGCWRVTGYNEKFVQMWRLPDQVMAAGEHRKIAELSGQQFAAPGEYVDRIDEIYAQSPTESFDLLELADGRVFERFSKIQFVDGRNVGRVWSLRDITERRQAEVRVSEQAELHRVTLASIGDAVLTTDAAGLVTFLNDVAVALTGWTREAAADQPVEVVFKIVNEFTGEPVESPVGKVLREGVIVGLANHTVLIAKDGTRRPIDDSGSPIRNAGGRMVGVVLVFRDVTERRQAEAELREADRRKDEFLAMLAHELRNPLAPIRNAVQIVKLLGGDDETLQSASEMMERQILQMVRLVDDLLDVSRISRGQIELRRARVELASILHQAVETSRPAIESAQHELTVTLPPQPVYLHADQVRLAQAFSNLLNNSCKYSEPASRMWLTTERQGSDVVVSMKDTGVGIPPDMLPKIFEMFTQVDRSLERTQGGLGIGLTLVQRLVEMHGGSVSAFSDGPGRGSEFIVRLPTLSEMPHIQPPSESSDGEPTPTSARRILVVDDNRDSARSLAMLLKLRGNETHTAYDGLEAVAAAEMLRPDVVLLDIGLPKLNGYEAARKIRQQPWGKNMVLVALTGWGQDEDRQKSKEAGFSGHLVKPVDHSALTTLLTELL